MNKLRYLAVFLFAAISTVSIYHYAQAATSVTVTDSGLPNALNVNAPVGPGVARAILKVIVHPTDAGVLLGTTTIAFSGTSFATTSLRNMSLSDMNGGISLVIDANANGLPELGPGGDPVVPLKAGSGWLTGQAVARLVPSTLVPLTADEDNIGFVVIRPANNVSNGVSILATIATNGVETTDAAPTTQYTSAPYVTDATAPSIVSAKGYVGSANVTVRFSEPVFNTSGGSVGSPAFTFFDRGETTTHSTSSANHTAGQDVATVVLSGVLDAGDFVDGGNGISTIAAGAQKITDAAGNFVATTPVNLTNPLDFVTNVIPNATASTVYAGGSPLTTLLAAGGSGSFVFSTSTAADGTNLASAGLMVLSDGKIIGTAAATPGTFSVSFRVTDGADPTSSTTRMYTINVASAGGAVPAVTMVNPGSIAQGTAMSVALTGSNTSWSGSSQVAFLLNGQVDANLTASSVTASDTTHLSFTLTAEAQATAGMRDIRVTTGQQVVFMQSAFGVFAAGGSGLSIMFPGNSATGVPLTPGLSFSTTTTSGIQSYRVTVNTSGNFGGTTVWDYVFPTAALSASSHCSGSTCNLNYGSGTFKTLTQPTSLAPNTTYYWKVRTYTSAMASVTANSSHSETTSTYSFTTSASVSDSVPPSVMFRPFSVARKDTPGTAYVRVFDNVATPSSNPPLSAGLIYCKTATTCSPETNVDGTSIGSGYYRFDLLGTAFDGLAGTYVKYHINAYDGINNNVFRNTDNSSFSATIAASYASVGSITGTVTSSGSPVSGATVFVDGTTFGTTTVADGTFLLSDVPSGSYELVAVKDGYSDTRLSGIPAGATGITMSLNSGYSGGFGGDTSKPRVRYTTPGDGSTNMPGQQTGFMVSLTFDKDMSQSQINSTNLLVKRSVGDGTFADITSSGAWTYDSTTRMATWTLSGSNTFGDGKTIQVVALSTLTDTSGNTITSNKSDGSYGFSFTTGSTVTFSGSSVVGGTFGVGAYVAPWVQGTNPTSGSSNLPVNTKPIINFSDPMSDDGNGYILKNNVKLYSVSGTTETDVSASISTVTLDTAKTHATVTLSGSFTAGATYRMKVLGGAKASNGMTMSPPGQETNVMYTSELRFGSSSDTGAPTVTGSFPTSGSTGVPVGTGAITVAFSKDMNVSTITSDKVYLSTGSSVVNANLEYRDRQVIITPKTALSPQTTYTINLTTGVAALNGTAFASAQAISFTTGAADTGSPTVMYANTDEYSLAITFSKPMNAADALDTLNWSSSVLNKAVYSALKYGTAGTDVSSGGTSILSALNTATFTYDGMSNTVTIKGLGLTTSDIGKQLFVQLYSAGDNVAKDISGNAISASVKSANAIIKSSAETKGALGPSSSGSSAVSTNFQPTNFSTATFGYAQPVEVRPFNAMAGQSTIYGVRVPISTQIPAGGTVVVTFPTGFDVSGAKQDTRSPMRNNINNSLSTPVKFKCTTSAVTDPTLDGKMCGGAATVTGDTADAGDDSTRGGVADDGVVVNTSLRSVTVTLSEATKSVSGDAHDFLQIDISGIVNTSVPKDFNTSGYSADVKTMNGTTMLESMTSMPFYIQAGGSYSLGGNIALGSAKTGSMKLYMDSPATGFVEKTVAFSNEATVAYSFTSLPSGEYRLFTEPVLTIGATEFAGMSTPKFVRISGGNVSDAHITLTPSASISGTTVTVRIAGPAGTNLDVFANSPTANLFRVKQVTLDGDGNSGDVTLTLASGDWNVGVGPQMPKGFMSGPPPAPNYTIPRNENVRVSGSQVIESSGTANDGTLAFTLSSTSKTIKGTVKDASGKIMSGAEVYAYSTNAGFGTRAQTDTAGQFTLNVVPGTYSVGSFVPGMPPSKDVPVVVKDISGSYLFIDGSVTGVAPAFSALTLSVAKPSMTIAGKVTDGTNAISGASVYAYKVGAPGDVRSSTDTTGSYTLYVGAGTWKVGAFVPGYGKLAEQTVTITTESASSINFSPAGLTTYTLSGTVTQGGSPVSGAFVRVSGNSTFNEAVTDSAGSYSMNLQAGSGYVARAVVPGVGELPPATVNIAANTTQNFSVTAPQTITFYTSTTTAQAFIELVSSGGVMGLNANAEIRNGTTTSIALPTGLYRVNVRVPGTSVGFGNVAATTGGTAYDPVTGIMNVDGAESLTITLPSMRTISGTVTDGTDPVANAWVEAMNANSGIVVGAQANASGVYSLSVSDAVYKLQAMAPGYLSTPTSVTVNGANVSGQTITVATTPYSISGTVYAGGAAVSSAFIRAEKTTGGMTFTQADANGTYSLPVDAGSWRVFAVAEGYAEAAYSSNPVVVSAASPTGKDITLTTTVSLQPLKTAPMTPSVGGTFEDTASRIKIMIPANALGSSASAGNMTAKETNNVTETSGAKPVGGKGREINATDANGAAIKTLNSPVDIEISVTKAELAATESYKDSSIDTKDEAEKLTLGYWDETAKEWVEIATTIKFYNSSDVSLDSSSSDLTPASDLSNVSYVTLTASTNHFSLYAPISPTDPSAPASPSTPTLSVVSASAINLSWTAVDSATSYDVYRSTSESGTYSLVGSDPTTTGTSYSDTGLSAGTRYYYKISALNGNGESAASSAANATTSTNPTGGGAPGGGGGGYAPVVPPQTTTPAKTLTPAATPAAQALANASQVAQAVSPVFTRALKLKETSSDVKRLQQLLNSDPDTKVASSGAGSPGKETTYFGPATVKAIQKFQVKYKIAKPGEAGYGNLGPKTRAKVKEVFSSTTSTQATTVAPAATTQADTTKEALVKKLEEQLKAMIEELAKMKR